MSETKKEITRCAIYTRKSTDENLDTDYNSLDAQREAAENYIASQRHEGWLLVPEHYDDGGFTGGNIDRPGLKKLMNDVIEGRIDCVVVYKVDRLSRSLVDFAKLMDVFDKNDVSFVSVTQQFNTTTSMGRLTLNILLSFAQFEREIITERIRDKIAGAKKRGKLCGGPPILGYDIENSMLVVNEPEAKKVREIFRLFLKLKSAMLVARELNERGWKTKAWTSKKGNAFGGKRWLKVTVTNLLKNPKYAGYNPHNGVLHPGRHKAIIDRSTWEKAQAVFKTGSKKREGRSRTRTPSLLKGLIRCGHCDHAMGITYTKRHGKTYRYYVCIHAHKNGYGECPIKSISAGEIESLVVDQIRSIFRAPEIIARVYRELNATEVVSEADVVAALQNIDPLWEMLFPVEQARIVANLVESVIVTVDGIDLNIHANGMLDIAEETREENASA